MWKKGDTSPLLLGVKLVQPLWKAFIFVRKLGNNLPQDPVITLLGIYQKEAQLGHKNMCSTMFIAELFVIARTLKQVKCPSPEEWIKRMW